ncbi:amidohydrolase [Streptomyces oryzae]|uniref:Amidohydrolase n=1 Tax=Streptomyces oryzae TaxID=1434886 RepID=A0ABS3XBL7_9ACTN|nr:M20 family metallopeptidase [Streptomyces oryzae]MBO8192457.1 amidohydrolase [Streptomyces oryzae]
MSHPSDRAPDTGYLTDIRRALHQVPEVGLHLPRTQALVLEALSGLGLDIATGVNCSSVVGVLRGDADVADAERRCVLLRGDMDGLPIREAVDVEFRSRHDGAMHACGHDLHTAMLIGAAATLAGQRERLPGDVVFMFQPGEEGFDGAAVMIEEGVLDAAGRRPDAAWALHVMSGMLPRRVIAGRAGPMLAASNELRVTVHGVGGHGSAPHRARNPISAAAEMVSALHALVSRTTSAFEPAVLNVGEFHAGTMTNIIPPQACFSATVRCFSDEVLDQLEADCRRVCHGVATAHRLEAEVEFERLYPVTLNDPSAVAFAADVIDDMFGSSRRETMTTPVAGAEDFSRILQAVPGGMFFLGASDTEDWQNAPDNHSPHVVFDETVLPDGASFLSELALRSLTDAASLGQSGFPRQRS